MNRLIVAVLCGLLFGAGMVVSDMINRPASWPFWM
jgi:hypothetical protein